MARYVIVVPPDMPETCAELSAALAGEDVSVLLDRRQGDRRRQVMPPIAERRRQERRGPHPPAAIRPSRADVDPDWVGSGGSR